MKKALPIFFIIAMFCNCRNLVTIEGSVKNLPANTIYLIKQGTNKAIDSSKVENNKFLFSKKVSKKYEPVMATLSLKNKTSGYSYQPFYLYSLDHRVDSTQHLHNLFYVEKGKTVISGDYKELYLTIQTGKENSTLFNAIVPRMIDAEENIDSVERQTRIEEIVAYIKSNSSSYYFFKLIDEYKISFTPNELEEILPLFSHEILNTKTGKKLRKYVSYESTIKSSFHFSNFKLTDANGNLRYVLDTTASVTILNFWASWCVPCRSEIPLLKNIYSKYRNKGLNIIFISINKNENDWKEALNTFQMPWQQFRLPEKNREKWYRMFDAYSVPETLILSKDFSILKKTYGFEDESEKTYESVISKLLNNQRRL